MGTAHLELDVPKSILPVTNIYGSRKYSAHYRKRKVIINITQLQNLQPTAAFCLQDRLSNSGTNIMGLTNCIVLYVNPVLLEGINK